ncbi:HPr family phosphocarrier protein [Microbacterium paludicola]|jgi:phosphotransferase system HPr (HPr) family protein|uniref:Phosphocarrier protein HPr n=1 Tax=Microbacterium paludicola TaxID=300019 RepID=A0A4Y9FY32_9MICO|nr:HPr family phosphocarrier protein [Microbacterium paludicola]MBF0816225.1 HPr family phosphocarrier protein [Microbacterium paludicola]TFU33162.1 HPr family phosphocarrier protein [Microbacterium paludicola]
MAQRRVVITAHAGLHARPAAELARLAQEREGGIRIRTAGATVDAASVLAVMDLALERGAEIVLETEGPDAEAALETAAGLLDPRGV